MNWHPSSHKDFGTLNHVYPDLSKTFMQSKYCLMRIIPFSSYNFEVLVYRKIEENLEWAIFNNMIDAMITIQKEMEIEK